jgi:hypothetical protein
LQDLDDARILEALRVWRLDVYKDLVGEGAV